MRMTILCCIRSSLTTSTLAIAALLSFAACEEEPTHGEGDPDAGMCPAGPQAPLDTACDDDGLICRYGYNPPACGVRTVVCRDGKWAEHEHTDPSSSCMDSSVPDGGTDAHVPDASTKSDATTQGDAALACEAGLGMDASCAP